MAGSSGVKPSKELRKGTKRLLRLANHPIVSDTVAAALIAGAAALAQNRGRSEASKAAGLGAAAAAVKASKGKNRIAVALAVALAEMLAGRIVAGKPKKQKKKQKK